MQTDYITDVAYVTGYFPELSVPRLALSLLAAGHDHRLPAAPAYLELGYGQGLCLAVHGAAMPGRYVGTDFNAAHAANAQQLVDGLAADIRIHDDSFEQLAERSDLPDFDVIVLHGIWSWVSEASRQAILAIAARRLRPGGVLYVSYNAIPGWSTGLPLRHLLKEYAAREATGGRLDRVDQSLAFAETLAGIGTRYFNANPLMRERLADFKSYDRHYVAHEFFNENWLPMAFSEVADAMAEAKLGFAASAAVIENISSIYLPAPWREQLAAISSDSLRETVRDYMVNQSFRRDIFVKGTRRLAPSELRFQQQAFPFIRISRTGAPPTEVRTPLGPAELREDIYEPLTRVILERGDDRVTLAGLLADPRLSGLGHGPLWEALLVLVSVGWLAPCPWQPPGPAERANALAFNRARAADALLREEASAIVAPAIGGGLHFNRLEMLMLHAQFAGIADPAAFLVERMALEGRDLLVDDQPVTGEAARLEVARGVARAFTDELLPLLRRLAAL